MPAKQRLVPLRWLPRSKPAGRRGSIAVALAVSATALLGMAALASEAGTWLTVRRNAQGAADAGAIAGIYALTQVGTNEVDSRVREVVTRNGFTNGTNVTVTVETGLWSGGAFATPAPSGQAPNAVRVQVTQPQTMVLARLISTVAPIAWGGAVAARTPGGPACVLSVPPPGGGTTQVDGSVYISGSNALNAPNCLIASNKPGRRSIELGNNAAGSLVAAALRAHGQCYNCDDVPEANVPGGTASGAPLTENPFEDLDDRTVNPIPRFTGNACVEPTYRDARNNILRGNGNNEPNGWVTMTLTSVTDRNAAPRDYTATCGRNVQIGSGQTLRLTPGTYYFSGASLIQTGGRIVCDGCSVAGRAGVTLVFTGNSSNDVGAIRLTGGTFELIAPGTGNGAPAAYDGVAIYRDNAGAVRNAAGDNIRIEGNSGSTLFGGVYAPTSEIQLVGTATMNPPPGASEGCMSIVGGRISLSGNSAMNVNACQAYGTGVAQIWTVRLVQ